ncbi:MAG: DNA mismatch repair protein MutT [Planctomycetaceae bacterium]|nr:DNA mismatch repair protein MutT [Planctomycetaceae bacterium]
MPEVKSCGVIVFRQEPRSFLLMQHHNRWDLPKGHVDPGETDIECALRELEEETAIRAADIDLDDRFCFENRYPVRDRRFPEEECEKTLRIFLAWLNRDVEITPTEHIGYKWFSWHPPHQIQTVTIDPLLTAVEAYFRDALA